MTRKKPIRIYVDMVADLFHAGHVAFLKQARTLGDQLIVGIHSDATVASYKRQPIMTMAERIAVVKSCRYVDEVVPNAPLLVTLDYLDHLQIDYVCHGDDANEEQIEKWYGEIRQQGRFKLVPYTKNISTSELIRRVASKASPAFVSQRIRVDFIAYHDLQAQAGLSVFEAMRQHFDCRWLIGPNQKPTGAEAAILLDHTHHQPDIQKSPDGYQYLFYLSHDLGDVNVYEIEKQRLLNFNIIFVPGFLHLDYAQKALGFSYAQSSLNPPRVILEGGWSKYDNREFPEHYQEFHDKLLNLPYEYTILYAPTWAYTREWEYLLPWIQKIKCNLIIKNHIYVNPGQSYPQGHEKLYEDCLKSAQEMEEWGWAANCPNIAVAPRNMNICSLFPFTDVLISDQSSVTLEVLPFALSIETGRFNPNPNDIQPQSSVILKDVCLMDREKLHELLLSEQSLSKFISNHQLNPSQQPIVRADIKHSGKLMAMLIDKYLSFWQVNGNVVGRSSRFEQWMNQWQTILI